MIISKNYINAFSGSSYGNIYLVEQGKSSWVPFTASGRELNELSMNEIIDEEFYEIIPQVTEGISYSPIGLDANFEYENFVGSAPLTVDFIDTSIGNIISWFWEFGDGQISSERNPQHTYTTPLPAGNGYTVKLTVTDIDGNTSIEEKNNIIQFSEVPPTASFSATPTIGQTPLTVTFINESIGTISSNKWNFGDGHTSSQQNPIHTYQNTGSSNISYSIMLEVTGSNPGVRDSVSKSDYIQVTPDPSLLVTADFSANMRVGQVPLSIVFEDQSVGDIDIYKWEFGDGCTSSQQNPIHIYETPGSYNVTLQVTGSNSEMRDSITQEEFIQVTSELPSEPPEISVLDLTPGGYLHVYQNSDVIYDATGSFTVEILFKMKCYPSFLPDDFGYLFHTTQNTYYSADFPWDVDCSNMNFTYDNYYNYPVTWHATRGFSISLRRSSANIIFDMHIREFMSGSVVSSPWDYVFNIEDAGENTITGKRSDIPESSFAFSTGSQGDEEHWSGKSVKQWFEDNLYNYPNVKNFKRIYSSADILPDHWYHVIASYVNQYVPEKNNYLSTMILYIKDVDTGQYWINDLSFEDEKMLPTLKSIGVDEAQGSFGDWNTTMLIGSGASPGFPPISAQVPSYPKPGKKDRDDIKISSYNKQLYGNLKYTRFWNAFIDPFILATHSLSLDIDSIENDPNINIENLLMFVNANEGAGTILYDKSNHATDMKIHSGSSWDELPVWGSDTIP